MLEQDKARCVALTEAALTAITTAQHLIPTSRLSNRVELSPVEMEYRQLLWEAADAVRAALMKAKAL